MHVLSIFEKWDPVGTILSELRLRILIGASCAAHSKEVNLTQTIFNVKGDEDDTQLRMSPRFPLDHDEH